MKRPPVSVTIVWHPRCVDASPLARLLYSGLCRNISSPVSRGLGIPVYFHTGSEGKLPPPIRWDEAKHCFVVLLSDDEMVAAGPGGWTAYAEALNSEAATYGHSLFPVAMTSAGKNLAPCLLEQNYLRLYERENKVFWLELEVCHALCVALGVQTPIQLFISHAKVDGKSLAERLRDRINKTRLKPRFDTYDLPIGEDFWNEIEYEISQSAVVTLETDNYWSRYYCEREADAAKEHMRAMVIVDAVMSGQERRYPYGGNVPTIRWEADDPQEEAVLDRVLLRALKEVLRGAWVDADFAYRRSIGLLPDEAELWTRPPEVVTLKSTEAMEKQSPRLVVYPDPPVAAHERRRLHQAAPHITVATPTTVRGLPDLSAITVGISVSDGEDLGDRGLAAVHLDDVFVELARYLLACGAVVAYGGDYREGGFTETLFDLAHGFGAEERKPVEKIAHYIAWPLYTDVSVETVANRALLTTRHLVKPPREVVAALQAEGRSEDTFLAPVDARSVTLWALSMTAMRRRMTSEIGARIIASGRLFGASPTSTGARRHYGF